MRRLIALAVFLSLVPSTGVLGEDPVYFADANLKQAVEDALGVIDPTPSQRSALSELIITWWHYGAVRSLEGIEYATNLTTLKCEAYVTDTSPLSGLASLRTLELRFAFTSDCSDLAGLTNLTVLSLGCNQICDVSSLSGLQNLEFLDLQDNQISDISPLASLTNLRVLQVSKNQIEDIEPLVGLACDHDLDWLLIGGNPLNQTSVNELIPRISVKCNPNYRPYRDPTTTVNYGGMTWPLYTLTVSSTNGGSVEYPGTGTYTSGTHVPVDARADSGYSFRNWTGTAVTPGGVGNPTKASTIVKMYGDYLYCPTSSSLLKSQWRQ